MNHDDRMKRFSDAGLYIVTSQSHSKGRATLDIVGAILDGGCRLIQLREKTMTTAALTALAEQVRRLTERREALLIVNDRLDVAMAVGADGVHLGQEDMPVAKARRLAPELIIGVSTHSAEEAIAAQESGASYVNIGPLFPTQTKAWNGEFIGWDGLQNISRKISIPYTVMGGIKKKHIPDLIKAGVRLVAVVTAVTEAEDPAKATRELLVQIKRKSEPTDAIGNS